MPDPGFTPQTATPQEFRTYLEKLYSHAEVRAYSATRSGEDSGPWYVLLSDLRAFTSPESDLIEAIQEEE